MAKKATSAKQPVFEESLKELEKIVCKLESGKLGLAESLDQYEEGVGHLKDCYKLLDHAERRIEVVTGTDPAGGVLTESFAVEQVETLIAKGAVRGTLRSRAASHKEPSEVDDESSLF